MCMQRNENNTRYNVEMQVSTQSSLGLRSRYYQSQMDMEMLLSGSEYEELPKSYVIFICDFDPFGRRKYKYTFEMECKETSKAELQDKRTIIFLSTKGKNAEEVPKELVHFLKFVKADIKESQDDFQDEYVKQLQKFVEHIKKDREMEERFMLFEELLKEERKSGKEEGRQEGRDKMAEVIITFLSKYGEIPDTLLEKINAEKDMEVLKDWISVSTEVSTIEEFISKIS